MDFSTELYRFGVALAIGALVGFERQSRFESSPEDWHGEGGSPAPSAPELTPEAVIRQAVAAGESARYPAAAAPAARPETRRQPRTRPDSTPGRAWVPDFQQAVGLRTFILLALSGALAAKVSGDTPWVFCLALLVIGTLIGASYLGSIRTQGDLGLTSEISALTVFLLGGLCVEGQTDLAGAIAVVVTITLSLKQGLHLLASKIHKEDIQAVLKFAVLTLVIMPILPPEPIRIGKYFAKGGPEAVAPAVPDGGDAAPALPDGGEAAPAVPVPELPDAGEAALADEAEKTWYADLEVSPRKIWWMVILISGISFSGYILGKIVGTGRGLILTGVVGGLVSSTAVSLSYAQKSKESPELSRQFAIGILLANAIMPVRLLLVVAVIARSLVPVLAVPLLGMAAVGGLASLILHVTKKEDSSNADVPLKNPFEIIPALKFGILFGVVLFAAQVAEGLFGDAGLYGVAVVTGLTDVDAISLAVANMVSDGVRPAAVGAITIALAAISNTFVKGGFVATMGSKQLRKISLLSFGLMFLAAGLGIVGIVFLK